MAFQVSNYWAWSLEALVLWIACALAPNKRGLHVSFHMLTKSVSLIIKGSSNPPSWLTATFATFCWFGECLAEASCSAARRLGPPLGDAVLFNSSLAKHDCCADGALSLVLLESSALPASLCGTSSLADNLAGPRPVAWWGEGSARTAVLLGCEGHAGAKPDGLAFPVLAATASMTAASGLILKDSLCSSG